MPAFLERKLQAEYGAKSPIPYKILNKLGAMRGNKETDKGRAMAQQHAQHLRSAQQHALGLAHHLTKLRKLGAFQ